MSKWNPKFNKVSRTPSISLFVVVICLFPASPGPQQQYCIGHWMSRSLWLQKSLGTGRVAPFFRQWFLPLDLKSFWQGLICPWAFKSLVTIYMGRITPNPSSCFIKGERRSRNPGHSCCIAALQLVGAGPWKNAGRARFSYQNTGMILAPFYPLYLTKSQALCKTGSETVGFIHILAFFCLISLCTLEGGLHFHSMSA